MKRNYLVFLIMCITFWITSITVTEASTKVMWGKTELKLGQIGKMTIIKDTNLVRLEVGGKLTTIRNLKKGEEFRVYQYKGQNGGLYGLGANSFIQKDDAKAKYETPSKNKVGEVKRESTNFFNVFNLYQPVQYGMNSKDLLSYLDKNVFYDEDPDEYYFDVNGYSGFNHIRASPNMYSEPSDKMKFIGDEKIGFNLAPSISYWENRKNQVFSIDFFQGYIDSVYNQKVVYETMIDKVSKDIGNPTRKFIRKDKYYEALWENDEEIAFFSTGIGGNGEAYMSLRIMNKKIMDPKFNSYIKTDKTIDIDL